MTSITVEATKPLGVKPRDAERSKNFFALGLICWMYTRPTEPLIDWIKKRFANKPEVLRGERRRVPRRLQLRRDRRALRPRVRGQPAPLAPGEYRQITGNVALSYGLVAAAQAAKLPLFYASYPITPASDILHELSKLKNFGVKTLQAEDEIAAAGIAIGAAFAGNLAITGHERSGRRPEVGGDRARGEPRAADDHRRRAARRPVDRPADQDRAGRPHARDVRPPRRGADADRRGELAERLLRGRVRGGPASRSSTARR